ncbi:MAG: hypothetical protein E3J56_02075 [Candidatus Aminicenantes bacterium]|nr:MAG: hypothetical protein E3J56_02075 [Candidatus Aminicenantes bacterium]
MTEVYIQFDTPLIYYYPIAKQATGIQWEQNALNVNQTILREESGGGASDSQKIIFHKRI